MTKHKRPVSWFRTIIAWGLGVPVTGLFSSLALLSFLFTRSGTVVHMCSRGWARTMLYMLGIKVNVSGMENLPGEGESVLIIANHQSAVDILVFAGYFPIRFAWIAKKELFKIPILGPAMKAAGNIAIDRLQKENAFEALDTAAQQLQKLTVVIFPEGTRSRDGRVGKFKAGATFLAHSAGAPLLPVTITGSWERLPPDDWKIAPGTVSIHIDSQIDIGEMSRREISRELQGIRDEMISRVDKSQVLPA